METSALCHVLMLALSFSSVLEAQEIKVNPLVTGYLGLNVTLPCRFNQGSSDAKAVQAEWQLNSTLIAVISPTNGQNIPPSVLKERVGVPLNSPDDFSLTIKDVERSDEGPYTCNIVTFPSGSLIASTTLTVLDQRPDPAPAPVSSGMVAGIVTAVLLVMVVVAATAYLIVVTNRQKATFSHTVNIDAGGPARRTVMGREEENTVIYSDITKFMSRNRGDGSSVKHNRQLTDAARVDDVTYSQVAVGSVRPVQKEKEVVYAQVAKK